MRALFAALIPCVLLIPPAAGTPVARCGPTGCICTASPAPAGDLARSVGLSPPEKPDAVLVARGDLWSWQAGPAAAIDRAHAGDGTCRSGPVPQPLDGMWQAESRIVAVACGPNTTLVRDYLEDGFRRARPVRIIWTAGLDGATFETAWRAANPVRNLEAQPWRADGPLVQRADIARRDRRSSARLELLAPGLMRLDWTLTTVTELTPCTVSVTQDIRRTGE